MKKILAIVLMTMLLVTPALASGEPAAQAPAAAATVAAPVAEPECNHAFTVEQTAVATCTEKGLLTYACSKCDLTYTVETLPIGHAPSAAAATCDTDVVCLNCGEILEAAIGHAYAYQNDYVQAEDGTFTAFGTWLCENCGDVTEATEGNAVYYAGLQAEKDASAEPSAEASSEASAEAAAEPAAEVANPNYDPYAYNWASICLTVAIVIVVVGAVLMLSFGKKKKD